ncbi:DUF4135 domain-containing protein [Streptomyces sp. I05A-00742]|uniref:DUF4135 domain-containing protein n=1 Tax=Streptomyces sp. I05A-00742 TaxID=2732853 RepID=UPI001488FE3E|nr:DUF4135 domain-containing protein [Streptomyces sp. I05A-00742]
MPVSGPTAPALSREVLDPVTRLVLHVRDEGACGMFPPVAAPGPQGLLAHDRDLRGVDDAQALERTLAHEEFNPFVEALCDLDAWCARTAPDTDRLLAPGVLAVTNTALFGPPLAEIFEACRLAPAAVARHLATIRTAQWIAFLGRFLERLDRDLSALRPDTPAPLGPVTGLWAHGDETHNGGRRVLRLTFADGGSVAYKDRPAGGEALFLAARRPGNSGPASVFDLLNGLPPASGPTRLPVFSVQSRRDASGPYSWQEWVEPPKTQGVLREEGGRRITGTVLTLEHAHRFWRDAGALAATTFGLGVVDLNADNVLSGRRRGRDEGPLAYPVDLEVFFADVRRLHHTGLTGDGRIAGTHHVGFENEPRWCGHGGPALVWHPRPDGSLELIPYDRPFTRTSTRSVVGDTAGRTGYGPHLATLMRGMFDAWTLLCRHRAAVLEHLAEHAPTTYVRIIPRPTGEYHDALVTRLRGDTDECDFSPAELRQLDRWDIPYFFRTADGGPLLTVDGPAPEMAESGFPPVDAVRHGERLTLAGLGAALRDAAEGVFDDVPELTVRDTGAGVSLRLDSPLDGHVSFDWPETGRRITYLWNATTLRLRVEDLGQPPAPVPEAPAGGVRRRLLRLNETDTALRTPWAVQGFADDIAGARLEQLTEAGLSWLRTVVAEHGWPGRSLVGTVAAGAACRLLQHTTSDLDFRRHCLELVRAAAGIGDVPWRDVAYLTDTIRLAEGRPQVYGTKFDRVDGRLRPFPMEDPEAVDKRRAALGMEPLKQYARRLCALFPDPADIPRSPAAHGTSRPTDHPEARPAASPHTMETS